MSRHDALCLVAELRCEAAMWERRGEHALAEARRATARRIMHGAPVAPAVAPPAGTAVPC